MTINLTDVTFGRLVAEQLHHIVPCDWHINDGKPCPRTAHWSTTCPRCSDVVTLCNKHRAVSDRWEEFMCDGEECTYIFSRPFPWAAL